MAKRHDDSYLTDFCKTIRDLSDKIEKPPCKVYTDSRGRKHPQHYFVLVYMDEKYVEYRCMSCLKYSTYNFLKVGQQELF